MQLVRFASEIGPRVGVVDGPAVYPLDPEATLAGLLAQSVLARREKLREELRRQRGAAVSPSDITLLAPVDGRTEVWAAGVTYERSKEARISESQHEADVYDRVYDADRPELFFKSVGWRAIGPGGKVAIRADSEVNVPEPELAVVYNAHAEPVGYTVCNDMSSRSIEGENPLYLPQAKIYAGSCALGPGIRPAWEVPDPYALTINCVITRDGAIAWEGSASTKSLHRGFDELAGYLFREQDFPDGVVLSTGTSLVPDLPFTLLPGDVISVEICGVGRLVNTVVRGKDQL
jgi:2-dehydro-3-deoxy-D-arabinonate dehydratase